VIPLTIQMQIDLCAQAHQRELADAFAALRERLLSPEPRRRFTMEEVMAAESLTGCYFPFPTLDALLGSWWLAPGVYARSPEAVRLLQP
jgi:hypothetical protein